MEQQPHTENVNMYTNNIDIYIDTSLFGGLNITLNVVEMEELGSGLGFSLKERKGCKYTS